MSSRPLAHVVDGRATGSQHAAQKAARWCRWEENSQHAIIMPADLTVGGQSAWALLVMLHLILSGAHHDRCYNSHLGWTDVRRARAAGKWSFAIHQPTGPPRAPSPPFHPPSFFVLRACSPSLSLSSLIFWTRVIYYCTTPVCLTGWEIIQLQLCGLWCTAVSLTPFPRREVRMAGP